MITENPRNAAVPNTVAHRTPDWQTVAGALGVNMCIALVPAISTAAFAADVEAGREVAAKCAACHGKDGNSINGLWPKLAGQHAPYLVKQLRDFRAGRRSDPVMKVMASTLSDSDIENVAAYFSRQAQK